MKIKFEDKSVKDVQIGDHVIVRNWDKELVEIKIMDISPNKTLFKFIVISPPLTIQKEIWKEFKRICLLDLLERKTDK
jgi:hypothetical protein